MPTLEDDNGYISVMATHQNGAGQVKTWLGIYWAGVGCVAEHSLVPSPPTWLQEVEDYLREKSMER